MAKKKIVIIGGSIAGCAMAALLKNLDFDVVVLEKSDGRLIQGAGVVLPKAIIEQCISCALLDSTIPFLNLSSRSFKRKTKDGKEETFWRQNLHASCALTWGDIYANLRKRVLPRQYKTHAEVIEIKKDKTGRYQIRTNKNGSPSECVGCIIHDQAAFL